VNTIRHSQEGEPASERRRLDSGKRIGLWGRDTEASKDSGRVVGVSRFGKGCEVNAGDLPGQNSPKGKPAGVRAAIVAQASRGQNQSGMTATTEQNRVMTGGAKGGRKANASSNRLSEETLPAVPREDKQGREDLWENYGAERLVWSEKMLAALQKGVKGNKWFSLIDKARRLDVLELAWAKVQSNAGAGGVDGITVEHFAKESQKRLLAVKEQLQRGVYQPQPVKRVWIPKPGSAEKRPLGIPTVRDRVVQSALRMVIEPIFEREFAPQSYGFRPGRSCHDALRRVDELLKSGHLHVVEIDIKGYFDAIPHQRLMALVEERIADGRVLDLIEAYLNQGVMEAMQSWSAESGTPQGAVISPLLANIYLNPLDWLMVQSGFEMVRYADDMVVLCGSAQQADEALMRITEWMKQAGLELNAGKTRVVNMRQNGNHFDFLGYCFWRAQSGKLRRVVRLKSARKLRQRLKPFSGRNSGRSMEAIVTKINPILRGWYEYFRCVSAGTLRVTDAWVRGRLRSILRKRRGGKGRGRGRDHQRWGNRYFIQLGLLNLEVLRAEELASLRNGAMC
jgi:RNA-directed DNA polymerase